MPSIERLHRELKDQGLVVLGVDVDESPKLGACRNNAERVHPTLRRSHFGADFGYVCSRGDRKTDALWGSHPTFSSRHDFSDRLLVAKFIEDFRLGFPVVLDAGSHVFSRYGVRGLPTTILIDRQGRVVGAAVGPRDWASPAGRALIRSLLEQPMSDGR